MTRRLAGLIAGLSIVLAASAVSAQQAPAQQATGDWLGTLKVAPTTAFRLAAHIARTPQGAFAGTLDSLDMGSFDIPLADIASSAGALSFTIPSIKASYAAKWDPAAKDWDGMWTQGGQSWSLTWSPGVAPPLPKVSGLDGDWDGTLQAGLGVKMRLAVHIATGPHGTLGNLNSIDQQARAGLSGVARDGARVKLDMALIGATFDGALDASGQTITGQWSQGGMQLPLVLTRRAAGQAVAVLKRPQTPVKPYPYAEEEVTFEDAASHVKLAGTLTLPPGAGPFPAVVLVSGSGPNTRNEPIMSHQIFLVLADHLTRHGIAVLRYDKRGTGSSTGDYAKATTQDFANDADAAAAWLRGRKEIDPAKVGLIGHSEGGLIVPMVAVADPKVDFIVMMAGPGVDGAQVLAEQGRLVFKATGMSDAQVADYSGLREKMIAIVRAERDPVVAAAKMRALLVADPALKNTSPAVIDAQVNAINNDWFRFFFNYDPAIALRQVRCPVLAMIGSKDLQVPPDQNLPALRAALAHNPDAEVDELPDLNHLFQTAKTGAIGEYGEIEETIAPAALDTMTVWIVKHVGSPAH